MNDLIGKKYMHGTNVTRASHICRIIGNSVKGKLPFSLVRFGDGEIKCRRVWSCMGYVT